MKLSCFLLSVFWPNMIHSNPIIKNNNIPACRNCKFFMPKYYNQFDSDMNRCVKFGEKDIITGKIEYDFVSTSRKDEAKCGLKGKEFEEEDNLGLHLCTFKMPTFGRHLLMCLGNGYFATDKLPFISEKSPKAISGLYNRRFKSAKV